MRTMRLRGLAVAERRFDRPKGESRFLRRPGSGETDRFGRVSEGIARFLGTPRFLLYLTVFVIAWLAWNTWAPEHLRFDSSVYGFTVLTLAQLKIMQEVITLVVFMPFAVLYMGQPIKLDFLWAGICLMGAVYFIFRT